MRYSFVVPIYNDAELADDFAAELQRVMLAYVAGAQASLHGDVELIFVNDGSPSRDAARILDEVAAKYNFVRVIELSRNFGQHIAISAGFQHASGEYVAMLNVDQEDPPGEIPKLLDEIQRGDADLVYGRRTKRHSPWHTRMTSRLFNWVLLKLTGYETPANVSTLRVMNRRFLDAYNALTEKSRYIPGLEMWMGFQKGFVEIRHQERTRGKSSYNLRRRLKMAFEAVISFSDLPLRITVVAGTMLALIGFALTGALIFGRLFLYDFQPGYTSTISLIVFLGGVQILVIGTASLYIGRVLREVQNRPLYIVRRKTNFNDPNRTSL